MNEAPSACMSNSVAQSGGAVTQSITDDHASSTLEEENKQKEPLQSHGASYAFHPDPIKIKLSPANFKTGRTAPFLVDTELQVFYQKPCKEEYLVFSRGSHQLTAKQIGTQNSYTMDDEKNTELHKIALRFGPLCDKLYLVPENTVNTINTTNNTNTTNIATHPISATSSMPLPIPVQTPVLIVDRSISKRPLDNTSGNIGTDAVAPRTKRARTRYTPVTSASTGYASTSGPTLTSTPYTPTTSYAPMGYTPMGYAPSSMSATPTALTGYGPTGYVPSGYVPAGHIPAGGSTVSPIHDGMDEIVKRAFERNYGGLLNELRATTIPRAKVMNNLQYMKQMCLNFLTFIDELDEQQQQPPPPPYNPPQSMSATSSSSVAFVPPIPPPLPRLSQ